MIKDETMYMMFVLAAASLAIAGVLLVGIMVIALLEAVS